VAGAGLQVTAQDLHEGGLAAAVGADQAITVAVTELDGNVLEQRLGAELHGDVVGGNQEADSLLTEWRKAQGQGPPRIPAAGTKFKRINGWPAPASTAAPATG